MRTHPASRTYRRKGNDLIRQSGPPRRFRSAVRPISHLRPPVPELRRPAPARNTKSGTRKPGTRKPGTRQPRSGTRRTYPDFGPASSVAARVRTACRRRRPNVRLRPARPVRSGTCAAIRFPGKREPPIRPVEPQPLRSAADRTRRSCRLCRRQRTACIRNKPVSAVAREQPARRSCLTSLISTISPLPE